MMASPKTKRISLGKYRLLKNNSSPDISSKLVLAQASGKYTDVTFTFPEAQGELKAHKLLLALGSEVFDTMLFSDLWDSNENSSIEILDIEKTVFKVFIEYLYTNNLPQDLSVDYAVKLWYASSKYCVENLEEELIQFLNESITLNTIPSILQAAILFGNVELESKCWRSFDIDADRVVLSDGFKYFNRDVITLILDREGLAITEINLFKALYRWGEFQCKLENKTTTVNNLKVILKDFLKKIRFPVMEPTEFANGPALSGLLTQEEISNIMITKFSTVNSNHIHLFSSKPRDLSLSSRKLECQCHTSCKELSYNIQCSFCKDRTSLSMPSKEEQRKSINMFQSPLCYCGCRVQGYCPARTVL